MNKSKHPPQHHHSLLYIINVFFLRFSRIKRKLVSIINESKLSLVLVLLAILINIFYFINLIP